MKPNSRKGVVLVACAPSGAGKTTLLARLRSEFPGLRYSVSCTTRAPRPGERDGADYHFLDRAEFLRRRDAGFFAEWAEVHGNLYGTPRQAVLDNLDAGNDVLFDIDVQGAAQLRRSLGQGRYVFILPPSLAMLEARLRGRASDADEAVARRLANAPGEIARAAEFDCWVVNDDLDTAYDQFRAAYLAETLTPACWPGLLDSILGRKG
jgi:guanylate kinase